MSTAELQRKLALQVAPIDRNQANPMNSLEQASWCLVQILWHALPSASLTLQVNLSIALLACLASSHHQNKFYLMQPARQDGQDILYCKSNGAFLTSGILVPDLCLEETEVMQQATRKAGLELTLLVTPTTPQDRMKRIAAVSEGFVYLVSVTGAALTKVSL